MQIVPECDGHGPAVQRGRHDQGAVQCDGWYDRRGIDDDEEAYDGEQR